MKRIILLSSVICFLFSCEKNAKLGHYVYKDDVKVLHTDAHCPKLNDGKDKKGHPIYAMQPLDTANLSYCDRVCSKCVSPKDYELLCGIIERNYKRKCHNNRKWLYTILERVDDLIQQQVIPQMPSYEEFEKKLSDPMFRRDVYDMLEARDYYYGQHRVLEYDNYEGFSRLMGFDE